MKQLVLNALDANQRHQNALASHAESLGARLEELDRLLAQADVEDADSDLECDFYIPNSKPPIGPVKNFNSVKSPFYQDTMKRTRYLNLTVRHTMTTKEVDTLKGAVNAEIARVEQMQGGSSSSSMTDALDWALIAEKVSDISNVKRSADECKIKWHGEMSSTVNRAAWEEPEVKRLREIISGNGEKAVDWVQVAKELGTNRLPIDCMRTGLERPRQIWTGVADRKVLDAVKMYGTSWNLVARYVAPDLTAHQCSGRYSRSLDPNLRHGSWTEEEEQRLVAAVTGYGRSWVEVASVIPGRTSDQCRDRWTAGFDPARKKETKAGAWSKEEDQKLLETVNRMGRKWKAIGVQMDRSGTVCRVRYEKLLNDDGEVESGTSTPLSREAEDDSERSTPRPPTTSQSEPQPRPKPKPIGKGTKRTAEHESEGPRKKRALNSEQEETDNSAATEVPCRRSSRLNPGVQ
ncbi:hypothetical protein FB45DRAFT_406520 [Roridomyces roridus]|uniref:Uncharacterized protein n=1 Tax=Roridomyces roridus TaxID=1738132 RepID=A0AAD7C406_9AGAR|nr:hypothetical protein FB45DRAFT_406520 [Roridomyces roridus]